ncbi:MAG: hypothetical protein MJA31_15115 [Clostridia bacterium]|nr:hypothetical protein [Clostridia bacterium]
MWAIVFMGHSRVESDKIKSVLETEGLLVKVRQIGKEDDPVYEILVPQEEVEDAHEVLNEAVY